MDPQSDMFAELATSSVDQLIDDGRQRRANSGCVAVQGEECRVGIRRLILKPRKGTSLQARSSFHVREGKAKRLAPISQRMNSCLQLSLHGLARLFAKFTLNKNLLLFRLRLVPRILQLLSLFWREVTVDTFAGWLPDGNDIFQELWLRCEQSNRDWSVPQYGFIHRVANNIRNDRHRRRTCYESNVARVPNTDSNRADKQMPLDLICRQERCEKIRECIEFLPEPYCSTLYSHYFAEQPVSAIANQQTVSEIAIKSRLRRARRMLKDNPAMQELAIA